MTGARGKELGVTTEQLVAKYPLLYHMAAVDSWSGIKKHGLLSTSRLLDLFEIPAPEREKIERAKRWKSVPIEHKTFGRATIRDQKPLSESKLKKCLKGCDLQTWFELLNNRVFFWLDIERLKTLMSAREYRGKTHTVLTVSTESLLRNHESRITLCHLNSGSTSPFAHPRGPDSFKRMKEYPFAERLNRGNYGCVAELAVEDGVPDIAKHTVRATHGRCSNGRLRITEILFDS
ncbi:MAG TPA: hypothetical protein VNX66_17595 [Candidatus Sulfotelmatobacter sp.]|nr:hypothetical protein [Candidatus Sulfotelmatobacter sp.]